MEMEMEDHSLLSIQDLLEHSRPLTGALSLDLSPSCSSLSIHPKKKRKRSHNPGTAYVSEGQAKIIKPMKYPSILSGTIRLRNGGCLAFTDHTNTCTVCCVVLHLDPCVIGRQIHLLSWNFIPNSKGSGYLEIYKWRPANLSDIRVAPPETHTDTLDSCLTTVRGRLYAISPPFYLPCVKPAKEKGNENKTIPNDSDSVIGENVCSTGANLKQGNVCSIGANLKQDGVDIDVGIGMLGKRKASLSSSDHYETRISFKHGHANILNENITTKRNKNQFVKKQRIQGAEDVNKEANPNHFDTNLHTENNINAKLISPEENNMNAKLLLPEEENAIAFVKGKKLKILKLHDEEENISNRLKKNTAEGSEFGFLIELQACNHKLQCRMSSDDLFQGHSIAEKHHTCVEPAFVYFTGSTAAWQPVLSGLFGKCLTVTGLKRKVILLGKEKEEYNIFVATRTTLLSLVSPKNSNNQSTREHFHLLEAHTCNTNRVVPIWSASGLSKTPSDLDDGDSNMSSNGNTRRGWKHCAPDLSSETDLDICKSNMLNNVDAQRCWKNCAPDFSSETNTPGMLIGKLNEQMLGHGGTGSYIGVVTGIHMQGSLIELDRNVWLLLSHQPLTQVHGLRTGVLLALMHVHFRTIQFAWEKILLLGACFRSHIVVKSFSPLRTIYNIRPHAWSLLSRYIESLPFTAAFWVLLITICFRRKFRGFFCEKEILGSKKHEGMVQRYVQLGCSSFHLHRDVLKEFFKHDSCPMGKSSKSVFQLVAPIINFCRQIEAMWVDRFSIIWKNKKENLKEGSILRCKKEELGLNKDVDFRRFVRRIISSRELGLVLIGILQVSQQSGHLQLVDATGALDVVVPDFVSNSSLQNFYEVTDFNLVVEGFSGHLCSLETEDDVQPISCARIIDGLTSKHKLSSVTYYVHFYLKKAMNFSVPRFPVACLHNPSHIKMQEIQRGQVFGILMVTHKYPITGKLVLDASDQNAARSFAEAVLLPYGIAIKGSKPSCYKKSHLKPETNDRLGNEIFARDDSRNCCFEALKLTGSKTNIPFKCSKTGKGHELDFRNFDSANIKRTKCNIATPLKCDDHGHQNHLSDYFYNKETISENNCSKQFLSETSLEIQCSLRFRNSYKDDVLLDGILFPPTKCQDSKKLVEEDPCLKKVLLEFNNESLNFHQLLHIGDCYLIQHETEHCTSNSSMAPTYMKTNKIAVSSNKPIWSLSIASYHKITQQTCHQNHFSSLCDSYGTPSLTLQFSGDNKCACFDNVENGISNIGWHSQDSLACLRDVTIYIPCQAIDLLQKFIKDVKDDMVSVVMDTYDSSSKCFASKSMSASSQQFSRTAEFSTDFNNEGNLLDGELVSLNGEVKDVHCKELNPFMKLNKFGSKCLSTGSNLTFLPKVRYIIYVQGSHGAQKIRLSGIIDRGVLPLGFGPGVSASFYRLLLQRDDLGVQELLVTAASFIVVNAIKEVEYHSNGGHNTEIENPLPSPDNCDVKDSTLISCLSQSLAVECFRLCCRVVAIQNLVLEWKPAKYESACPFIASSTDILNSIQIVSGRFILDDASGLCECWASGARAAYLLSIRSTAGELFENVASQCNISTGGTKKALKNSVGFLVEKLVKKHRQVTIQNTRTAISSNLDFMMLGASKEILNPQDRRLISLVLEKACSSAPLVIIGSILDSMDRRTGGLEKCDEIEMKSDQVNFSTLTQCKLKILARDVFPINYLQEAGNAHEELMSEI
ncbi:hypothetical protein KI387_022910 [Taxus chinensis]|uniref:CST complex subunit CTC1 n=1 Tax=Taxus chinensis TaxID=29808 RepID=A0AA38L731_TAXCH|nr:hypothetical protein KI387_022910 [Taxus chinensis]